MKLRRTLRRILLGVIALFVVSALATGAFAVYLFRRPFPQLDGELTVAALHAPVEIMRDRWGIPHIFAQNPHDLFFAQGYVHAQDRLWQMELFRRSASGRLSELFGPVTLNTDRMMRVVGLRRAAESSWAIADGETRAAVLAYAEGVNAYIAGHRKRLPVEFALLRTAPEPWTPVDSLAFGKVMAWILGGNLSGELLRGALASRYGAEGVKVLIPSHAPRVPTIIAGTNPSITGGRTSSGDPAADHSGPGSIASLDLPSPFLFGSGSALGTPAGIGTGSNNWVVAPSRSSSGGALLANDPHLELQMPSIWYENHLVAGPYNVIGASFAGVPGVIIGHNADIAWGVTNANPDVQDLYIEQFHPKNPDLYLFRGRWEQARVVTEQIRVKGRPEPVRLAVRITRHGPVINPGVRGLGAFMALRWTGSEPDRILSAVLGINRAGSWQEFRGALRHWRAPAQNFVFADRAGNIGYLMPGLLPIRPHGVDGRMPVPGWTGEYEWMGFVPPDRWPSEFNPKRGFIVTANNRVAPKHTHFLGDDFDPGFRAARITTLLQAKPKLDAEDFAQIQRDIASQPARQLVTVWQDVKISDPQLAALFDEVKRWDGELAATSRPAAVYEGLVIALLRELFESRLDPELFTRYVRRFDSAMLVLLQMSARPADPWWGPEGRDKKIERSLALTVRQLERRLGTNRRTWRWGSLHAPRFTHPLGRVRGLGWIFNTTSPETGGDAFSVNMGAFDPEDPYRQLAGPSYRQIIDAKDWSARAIQSTGQSGLPFHRHYRDFVRPWARGEYHPLLFDREAIQNAREGSLRLRPRTR